MSAEIYPDPRVFESKINTLDIISQSCSKDVRDHQVRVARLCHHLGESVGISSEELEILYKSGLYHDVGKSTVPYKILEKKGSLNNEERDWMDGHVEHGEKLALMCSEPQIARIIKYHHENWDGTGYLDRLKGEVIPLASRIIRIADVIDALLTNRVYNSAWSDKEVLDYLNREKGKLFDPHLVETICRISLI